MAILTWVLISLAVWHFAVFVPDKFAGGIVGAFAAAIFGGIVGGLLLSGLSLPSRADTDVATVLLGIPGCLVALAALWLVGARAEAQREA
ncbi:hypothetical protein PAI11_39960 [Patulibacter medicamentivorans]|uniref:Uncharacterized protein n=1 Tax=Patulibacter medicamentivorans TaxID=1097667 RepID=H0EAX1_9ACTN|nr:hypothetical protein [Patulibacter medicamentivorans]EHN09189.1 hypothetical protein PAI11_39960 [Patulibacter medicamentivorans]